MNTVAQNFSPQPEPVPEFAALARISLGLLNSSVTPETYAILVRHGMPRGEDPTIGNLLEMALSPDLLLLKNATEQERAAWSDWTARLMVLYREHAQSDEFVLGKAAVKMIQFFELPSSVAIPAVPFSRPDFDLLSWSPEIVQAMGARLGGDEGTTLGRSFQFELQRHHKRFQKIADLARSAAERLRE